MKRQFLPSTVFIAMLCCAFVMCPLSVCAKKVKIQRPKWTNRSYLILSYDMAMPVGNTYDFISAFSFVGFTLEYRYRIARPLSIGASIQWNNFEDKLAGTHTSDTITVTGTQIRRLQMMPICATSHVYLSTRKSLLPFLGINVGAYRAAREIAHAWWRSEETNWHFGLAPEIGLMISLKKIPIVLSSQFNWAAPHSSASSEFFVDFNIGVALPH